MSNVAPYLNFNGNCEEAVKFYVNAFGGDIRFAMRFKETPMECPPDMKEKMVHMNFVIEGAQIMASDCPPSHPATFGNNVHLSVSFDATTANTMEAKFNKLAQGGKVTMPLGKTFWAENFGMMVDKFGNSWMFNFEKKK